MNTQQVLRPCIRHTAHPNRIIQFAQFSGHSAILQDELKKIPFVAASKAAVLITGATGTGKELYARAIHEAGLRHTKLFMPVNCAGLSKELAESELFGHAAGAFTGATQRTEGLVRAAHGGTLFLDEINSLPREVQPKLLRLLDNREYRNVGSSTILNADVRIIAATNEDLAIAVANGSFRADLYHRLKGLTIHLPSLSDRIDDIPLLANEFLAEVSESENKRPKPFTPAALSRLLEHSWPGNVRELRNAIHRAVIFCDDDAIDIRHLDLTSTAGPNICVTFKEAKSAAAKQYFTGLMAKFGSNLSNAARVAGMDRSSLKRELRRYGLLPPPRQRDPALRDVFSIPVSLIHTLIGVFVVG